MKETWSHLRILLRARLRAMQNRLRFGEAPGGWALAALVGLGAAVIVGLGHFSAPALLEAPTEVAAGSAFGGPKTLPAGTTALEASFWLTLLASAVTSFRVMEILYRRSDIRAVERYPIRLPALYVDRLLAVLLEALAVSGAIALFFAPLCWHGAPRVAGLAVLVAAGGLVASTSVSFGLQLYAGALNARAAGEQSSGKAGGVYGGPGQLFMFSPGIALAASAILILLTRLAVGELLGPGGAPRGFWFGIGVVGVGSLLALGDGCRHFVQNFPTISARFREADAVSYEAELDYQESDFASPRLLESVLPSDARPSYRALSLQYGRGHALVRYSYVIGWLLGGLAVAQWSRVAFPPWAVALAPAVVVATAANPWYRVVRRPLRPDFAETLPLEDSRENLAALAVALRESLLLAGPYALLVVWVDWSGAGPTGALLRGSCALLAVLALNGGMALVWSVADPETWSAFLTPVALAVGLLVVGIVSLPALAATAAIVAGLQLWPFVGNAPEKLGRSGG